jgi:branched-chain amino acid transport system substrate-binding protein
MKKASIVIAGIIIIVLVIVGLSRKSAPAVTTKEPIKIGAVISLTGFAAPWGEYSKNGIDLAVKNINEKGGINGRTVEVVFEDDHTDAKDAVTAYSKLVNIDHVDGVIGSIFDFTSQPLLPLAETNKTALLVPEVFRIPGAFEPNEQSFVMYPEFSKTLHALKDYLATDKVKKLAVVHFQSGYGKEIAKLLDALQKENGKSGIIDEEYAKIGGNDFRTTIAKLKSQNVDTVFLDMVGDDPLNFLVQAKQLGFKPTIISYNGLTDAFTNEKDKSLLEGVVIINWEITSPAFEEMYKAAYTVEPTKAADKSFDAVYVLANAIANTTDKTQVANYIAKNKFTTPNSAIIFTADHAVENIPVVINVIKNGVQVPFKQ